MPNFAVWLIVWFASDLSDLALSTVHLNISQCSRSFAPCITKLWNLLPDDDVEAENLQVLKNKVNRFY